jgi:predicted RNA-binding protein (virulence factor B family)
MNLGEINELTILRFTSVGAYLGDEEDNDVLLPNKYLTPEMELDEKVSVFLYKDSEDRIVATTETPLLKLNEFALLRVKEVNPIGAFLDWGLEKDLLVPFREQKVKMEEGRSYLVTLRYDDASDRLFASGKIQRYLEACDDQSLLEKPVEILIGDTSELGVTVIVNDLYPGIIYRNDVNRPLRRGERIEAFVYTIREDGKLDVRLERSDVQRFDEAAERIHELLKQQSKLYLSDKSDPDLIRESVQMSKKMFKQAVGKLYKAKIIRINEDSIELIES